MSAHARTDCRDRGEEERRPLGTEVFGQVSLAGNRMASVAFAKPRFSGWKYRFLCSIKASLAERFALDWKGLRSLSKDSEQQSLNWSWLLLVYLYLFIFWSGKNQRLGVTSSEMDRAFSAKLRIKVYGYARGKIDRVVCQGCNSAVFERCDNERMFYHKESSLEEAVPRWTWKETVSKLSRHLRICICLGKQRFCVKWVIVDLNNCHQARTPFLAFYADIYVKMLRGLSTQQKKPSNLNSEKRVKFYFTQAVEYAIVTQQAGLKLINCLSK